MKKSLLMKTMLLLCALIVGSMSAWADETTVATFDSDEVVDNSAYANTYGGSDWSINMGGNNKSIGFNNKNCVTIGDNLGTSANASNYGIVVKSKNQLSNVNKITFKYTGGSGDGGKLYLAYSTDGTTWSAISLNSGSGLSAQGVTPAQNTTFTFEFETIASAYYGFILDKGNTTKAAYRFDCVTVNFINVPSSLSTAAIPTFSPVAGELTKAQNITVSSTGAAKIIYTTNGDEPTIGGATTTTVNAASASVLVNANMTIKAKGVDSSNEPSTMASATYTINLEEPVILPAERTYTTTTNVSFTQADDIDVYYTLDGTTPTSSSTKYNGTPFAITENVTIKAIAIDEYGNESDVVEAKFKNSELQETEFDISFNDAFFGTSYDGTASGITDETPESGTLNNVTVTYAGSGNHYINDSQIRFYPNNKLTFEAPAGYIITKIVFTADGTWTGTINSNNGTYTSSTKTWTGEASTVLFTGSGSGQCRISKAAITLSNSVSATVQSYGWATYIAPVAIEFEANTAFVVTDASVSTGLTLEEVTQVPAGTPLLLKGAGEKTATVISSATVPATNLLSVSDGTDLSSGDYAYVLAKDGEGACFKQWTGAMSSLEGRVVLVLDEAVATARAMFNLDDDVTAIEAVKAKNVENGQFFNLAGQRVAQPTKGLYIVNGKKVIIK